MADLTPAQTVGPFLHLALADPALAAPIAADDAPVPDAVVETWQYGGPFARCPTGPDGSWSVRIRRPHGVPTLDGTPQAPHVAISVLARGLLDRIVTRAYFAGDPANDHDPALDAAGRRAATLLAHRDGDTWRFDIYLQGDRETVCFVV